MKQSEELMTAHLRGALSQLRKDIDKAFAGEEQTYAALPDDRILGLTEYLLKIKEHELADISSEQGRFNKTILRLAKACSNIHALNPDIRFILDSFARVLDADIILWLQKGKEYDVHSAGLADDVAAKLFLALLPALSDSKTPMPYFNIGLDHYMVYTDADGEPDNIKAVLFTRIQSSFLSYEQELAGVLAGLIFKIKMA